MKNGLHFDVPLSSDWRSCRVAEAVSMDQPDLYEAVSCPACGRLHFIDKITGRLLGDWEGSGANVRRPLKPILASNIGLTFVAESSGS